MHSLTMSLRKDIGRSQCLCEMLLVRSPRQWTSQFPASRVSLEQLRGPFLKALTQAAGGISVDLGALAGPATSQHSPLS
jgi:hypothetical protein